MGALGKKKGLLLAFVTVVLVAGAGIAAWRFFADGGSGPERALPRVEGRQQIVVKMENPGLYKDKLRAAARLFAGASGFPSRLLPGGTLGGLARAAEAYADELTGLLDVAEQAAFLAAQGEDGRERFYLSFIPNGDVFEKLVEGSGNLLFSVETWAEASGGEGWIARPAIPMGDLLGELGELPALYLLKSGRARNAPVLVSGSPEAIDEMRRALRSPSSRASVARRNDAPDFIQTQFPVETPSGETKSATSEIAWTEDATSAHARFHTDAFSLMTGRAVPKSGLEGKALPLLGRGDLAFVAAADIAYGCFAAFPTAEDPVAAALEAFASFSFLPAPYREELRKILADGRLSFAVVAAEGETEMKPKPSTAYFVLETKETGILSRLLMLPRLGMRSESLTGWDSCHTMRVRGVDLILAQRGGMLLFGLGALEDYGQTAQIPDGIKDFAAPGDLAYYAATPTFWEIARPFLGDWMSQHDMDASLIDDPAFKPCTIHLRVLSPEEADIGFYWENAGP